MSSKTDLGIPGFDVIATLDEGRNPVYRARSLISGDEVAIKVFDRLSKPVLPRLFERRARTVGSLSRREIGFVPCVVSGDLSGQPYLVSPFYPDGSLDDLMRHGPLPWARAVRLTTRVCSTVAEAHDADLTLGDLRPTAVLLSGFDTPMVAAFGMAEVRFDDGAPTYEAPERIERAPLSPAADVYSISAMLAALMLGRARRRVESVTDYLEPLRDSVPATVLQVVQNGLTTRPGNRYGNARLLARALDAAILGADSPAKGLDHVVGFGPTPAKPVASAPTVPAPSSAPGGPIDPLRGPAENGSDAHADVGSNGSAGGGITGHTNGAGGPGLTDLVFAPANDRSERPEPTDETGDGEDLLDLLADIGLAEESVAEAAGESADGQAPPPPRPGDAIRLDDADPADDVVASARSTSDPAVEDTVVEEIAVEETAVEDTVVERTVVEGTAVEEPAAADTDTSPSAETVPPPPTAADLIRLDEAEEPTVEPEPTADSDPEPVPTTDAALTTDVGTDTDADINTDIDAAVGDGTDPGSSGEPGSDGPIVEVDLSKDLDERAIVPTGPSTDDVETSLGFEPADIDLRQADDRTGELAIPEAADQTGELDRPEIPDQTDEIDLRDDDDPTGGETLDELPTGDDAASPQIADDPTWPAPAGEDAGRSLQDSWGPAEPNDSVLPAATNTVDLYVGQFADDPSGRTGPDESTRQWVSPAAAFAGSSDEDGFGTLEIESLADLDEPEAGLPTTEPASARADLREQPTIDFASQSAEVEPNGVDPEKTLDPGSLPPSVAAMAATTIDLAALDVLYGNQSADDDRTSVTPRAEKGADGTLPLELTTLDDVAVPLVKVDGSGEATRTGELDPIGPDGNGHGEPFGIGEVTIGFGDDPTHIFPDDGVEPDRTDERGRHPEPIPAGPPFGYPSAGTGEEIPFTAPSVRYGVQHVGRWRRLATRVELAWFNSRRRISNVAAIIGIFLIAAVAVYFGAREVQRTSIEADEGVPLAPSSTTEPRASRNAPVVTDLPDTNPTTTRPPPRRVTTTTAAPTTPAPTTAAPTTAAPTTARPATTEAPAATRRRRRTTTEAPATTRRRTTTAAPTTNRRGRPTTEAPPTTEEPTTTAAPTTEEPTTARPDRPSSTEEPDDDDEELPFAAPPTIGSPDISVGTNSASIAYQSDQCVATRFLLTGEDGTQRRGSSPGFDPDVTCSTAWNLDFSGGNGLQPDTGYALSVWVRAKDTGLTTNARFTFQTSP